MIILEGEAVRLVIDPTQGGRIASLQLFGSELLAAEKTNPLMWGCYPMVPWAGRVRHGEFFFRDRRYSLPLSFPPHAIHGTTWYRSWEVENENTIAITLGEDWPFSGRALQQFVLSESQLLLHLELHAETESFPASLGWHPWFRRVVNGSTAILDFEAGAMYERDAEDIPTGRLKSPGSGPWDDCFTLLRRSPKITWPEFISLSLNSSADHWMLYDQHQDFVCVEPMTAPPNALNASPFIVEPGIPLCADFVISWERVQAHPNVFAS
jgi:aldose 1-epimerase